MKGVLKLVEEQQFFTDSHTILLVQCFDYLLETNEMATFVAKNSGGVKKKPMCFFFRFSFKKRRQRLAGMHIFTLK